MSDNTPQSCRCHACVELRSHRRLNDTTGVTPWAQPPLLSAGDIVAPADLFAERPRLMGFAEMTDLGVCVEGEGPGDRLIVRFGVDINGVEIVPRDGDDSDDIDEEDGDDIDEACRWTGVTDAGFQLVKVGKAGLSWLINQAQRTVG